MKNLTVILGAGASAGSTVGTGYGWNPPLTRQIFERSKFKSNLNRFELVNGLSSGLKESFEKDGLSIESYLNDEIGTLSKYSVLKPYRKNQYNQLPLYLQDIFSFVSETFGRGTLYTRLIAPIFDNDIKVTFITLNYDLLLDYALEDITQIRLDTFANYFVDQPHWVYFKPHGSINWFRIVTNYKQTGNTFDSWKALVNNLDINADLGELSILDLKKDFKDGYVGTTPYYPELAIPNSEYLINYPVSNLIEILATRLNECTNYLFIGFSAYDSDLLKVLNQHVKKVERFLIVGHTQVNETYERLIKAVPIFKSEDPNKCKYSDPDNAFSKFINNNDFKNFLNELR